METPDGCRPSEIPVSSLCIPKSYKNSDTYRIIDLSNEFIEIHKKRFEKKETADRYAQNSNSITTEYLINTESEIYRKILQGKWNPGNIIFKK